MAIPMRNRESGGSQCDPAEATETTRTLRSFLRSEPMLDVSPVGRGARHRHYPVELALDDRLDVNHDRTPFNLTRNAECAALSVAETVPTSTPSAAAMA